MKILSESIFAHLAQFSPRTICFAESDAADAGAGGDEPEIELEPEGEESDDDGTEEVEIGSERKRVTKDVAEAWRGMQTAHNKRSEEIAAEKAAIANRTKEVDERDKIVRAFPKEIAKIVGLQDTIEQYQKTDWAAVRMQGRTVSVNGQDVPEADYHWGQFQNAKTQFDVAQAELNGKLGSERAKASEMSAKQQADYHKEMGARVKDWSPEKDKEIRAFAVKQGIPKEVADSINDPNMVSLALLAMNYVKAMDRAKAKASQKPEGEEPLTPPAKAKTNGKPKADLASARTTEEFARIRREQRAKEHAARIGGRH